MTRALRPGRTKGMLSAAVNVLRTRQSFAVIGASSDPKKYGHEVYEALRGRYTVYPINPKDDEIDGRPCYPSLEVLPEVPHVVITAIAPQVAEQMIPNCISHRIPLVWMPPGCWTERAVELCRDAGVAEIHDVCPILAMRRLGSCR